MAASLAQVTEAVKRLAAGVNTEEQKNEVNQLLEGKDPEKEKENGEDDSESDAVEKVFKGRNK